VTPEQLKELNTKVDGVVEAQKQVRPNAFNPSIGLVGETVFSYAAKGRTKPAARGPAVSMRSALDRAERGGLGGPLCEGLRGDQCVGRRSDGRGDVRRRRGSVADDLVALEPGTEGWRFFGEFGKLSYIHDHELPFVNRPLVLDQYIGGESQDRRFAGQLAAAGRSLRQPDARRGRQVRRTIAR
jgi:hypothetical protein